MKQLSSQKWILSTLLFAALGSQYYFSTSSKDAGFIEMSMLASGTEQSIIEVTAALERSRPPADVAPPVVAAVSADASRAASADRSAVAASGDRTVRTRTEAVNPAAPCSDCVVLTKAEAQRIRQILTEVTAGKRAAAVRASTDVPETAAEKMKREREEREDKRREDKLAKEEKKREADLAKAEKKKDEQELRDEKFKTDFERISSRCSDVDCYSSSLATALNRYSDRSRMVSTKVVNEVFAEHIAKDLKDGLKDPENSKASSALETLMSDMPSSYRNLKTKAIDLAKAVTAPKAVEANESYKQAEAFRKANKIAESNAAFERAKEQRATLEKMLDRQYTAIHDGTEKAEDSTTMTYYNVNYAKPARKWLDDLMLSTFSTGVDASGTTVAVNPLTGTGRGVVRGGTGTPAATSVIGNPVQNNIGTSSTTGGFRGRSN